MDMSTQAFLEGAAMLLMGALLLITGDVYHWQNVTTFGLTVGGIGAGWFGGNARGMVVQK